MDLTTEQLHTLDDGKPVSLVIQGRDCVLLSCEAYQQVREIIEDWDPFTMQCHMADVMAEDWNDPAMGVYDD